MKYFLISLVSILSLSFLSCSTDEGTSIPASVIGDQDEDSTTETINDSYRYQLPIIFHVLYNNAKDTNQYVSYKRIKEILKNVNGLWKGGYYDYSEYGLTQDMGVDFVLADVDEDGNALSQPGVEYIKYSGSYPIDPETFMSDKSMKKYMWEPCEYINVMLYNFKTTASDTTIMLGISHLPYTLTGDTQLAGLTTTSRYPLSKSNLTFCYCSSINSSFQSRGYEGNRYSYYTNNNKNVYFKATDISSTIAHELGHYLGLFHVFAEDGDSKAINSSDDTDYCDDTESYNYFEYQTFLKKKTAMSDFTMEEGTWRYDGVRNKTYNATNMMDYWVCFCNRFTTNQRERVRNILYYSPLIPGPKKLDSSGTAITRAADDYILPQTRAIK